MRRLIEREPVRAQVIHAERITLVEDERHQVVGPSPDVCLAHRQLHALVEELEHIDRVGGAAIDADDRDRSAATDRLDALLKSLEAVDACTPHYGLRCPVREHADEALREVRPQGYRARPCRPHRSPSRCRGRRSIRGSTRRRRRARRDRARRCRVAAPSPAARGPGRPRSRERRGARRPGTTAARSGRARKR